jgi:thioesterase domain-containing protein
MTHPLHALEERILDEIALARHIGVRAREYTGAQLVLAAPLAANSNHHGTAFGGSLFSLAVLAAWGLLGLKLAERGVAGEIVIQQSRVQYRKPVTADFYARCFAPESDDLDKLVQTLERRGRGRIALIATIEQDGRTAVELEGTFAVVRRA